MKWWRGAAIVCDAVIVAYLTGLQAVVTVRTLSAIAEFEASTGMSADNDWGQRGLGVGFAVLLLALTLASASIWLLSRGRAAGFVMCSVLFLLMVPVLSFALVSDELETLRSSMQLLCFAGAVAGVLLSIISVRSARAAIQSDRMAA